jgi:EAL domain-containing protein (putative c-di-GMP-specific phosphodiesterase class I)
MYHAKQQGKAAFQYYSAEMNAASVERITLESGLRRALDDGALEVHFQPQLGLASGAIIGAEALLRWKHPQRGYVPPSTFVPIAENSGLLLPIGDWVLREACNHAVAWQRPGAPPVAVSVNVSGRQVQRQDVAASVRAALAESGLDPSLLWIEITETVLMSARERAVEVLEELRGLGVRIALDDFGTGYSSLSYLRTFPIDMLKLDRSFVADILSDAKTATIVEAIISMTRVLGLEVLAEGVESHEQLALLQELGCNSVQGFHVSAALPAAELTRRLLSAGSRGVRPLRAESA